jgi:excisionase family DNA binding protein
MSLGVRIFREECDVASTTTTQQRVPLAEAARLVPCSAKTLRRRIADGSLTGHRFGPRLIMVDLDELEAVFRPIPTRGNVA